MIGQAPARRQPRAGPLTFTLWNRYGMSVEPHQSASPTGTSSTGVGTKTARTKQMVAMIRTILLGVMGISPFHVDRVSACEHHSSSLPTFTPSAFASFSIVLSEGS